MVDVVIHKTFPTIVSEFKFDMDDSERDIVIKELGSVEKKSNEIIIQTNDKLAERIPNFTRNIFDIANKILRETFKYEPHDYSKRFLNKFVDFRKDVTPFNMNYWEDFYSESIDKITNKYVYEESNWKDDIYKQNNQMKFLVELYYNSKRK